MSFPLFKSKLSNARFNKADKSKVKEFEKYLISINVSGNNRSVEIDKKSFVLGRSKNADISINSDFISREHLRIFLQGEALFVEELGASNGSWIGNEKLPIRKVTPIQNHSQINLGESSKIEITVHCLFKEEIVSHAIPQVDLNEVTQVRFYQKAVGDSSPPPEPVRIIKRPPISIVKPSDNDLKVEPNLLSEMHLVLNDEAKKIIENAKNEALIFLENAKSEALEIKKNASQEASKIQANAIYETEKIRESTLKKANEVLRESQDRARELERVALLECSQLKTQAKDEVEKSKSEDENRKKVIIDAARLEANQIIVDARERSLHLVSDAEKSAFQKKDEVYKDLKVIEQSLEMLRGVHQDLSRKIEDLKYTEEQIRNRVEDSSKHLKKEEERIERERQYLEVQRVEVAELKKTYDLRLFDIKSEEQAIRTQIEIALEDQRNQSQQILDEVKEAELKKEELLREIQLAELRLKESEFKNLELERFYVENSKNKQELEEFEKALRQQVEILKDEEKRVKGNVLEERNSLEEFKTRLNEDEASILLKKKEIENLLFESQKEVRNNLVKMQDDKEKILAETKREKNNLLKAQEVEFSRVKFEHEQEIRSLVTQKNQFQSEIDEVRRQLTEARNKLKEELSFIQLSLTEKIEKKRLEAESSIEEIKVSTHKKRQGIEQDFNERKKEITKEIERLTKKMNEMEISRKNRLDDIAIELEDFKNEANSEKDELIAKNRDEVAQLQNDFLIYKEEELAKLEEQKEQVFRELYSKKNERANAVKVNVLGVFLEELNKYKGRRLNDAFIENCSKEIGNIIYDTVIGKTSVNQRKLDQSMMEKVKSRDRSLVRKSMFKKFVLISFAGCFLYVLPDILNSAAFLILADFLQFQFKNLIEAISVLIAKK